MPRTVLVPLWHKQIFNFLFSPPVFVSDKHCEVFSKGLEVKPIAQLVRLCKCAEIFKLIAKSKLVNPRFRAGD